MTITLLSVGRLVGGRYILEAPIGRGGMGEVWRARHTTLASPVAIKFLHAASAASESSRRRFLTEAQVTANLKTKHAVQVFDFGVTDDGLPFLVMELLEGETLERRIAREGRLPIGETARILRKAARALDRAHQLGIVHRDFKPENVMLVEDEEGSSDGGSVKVVDFGVAKLVGGPRHEADAARGGARAGVAPPRGRSPSSMSVSSTGMGTPFYMAPEQVQATDHVGPATDIWAFGVVAYQCLTGRRPFGGETVGELLLRILTAAPPPRASAIAGVPAAFDAWFEIACARDPGRRFPDVQAAAAALGVALAPPGELAERASPVPTGDIATSPRAESLAPAPPAPIACAERPPPSVASIVGGQSMLARHARPVSRRVAVAVIVALGALIFALRDAPSPSAVPATGPTLVSLARTDDAPTRPDMPAPTPADGAGSAPPTAPAATSIEPPPAAPERTRAAPRSRARRLPPLGF